MYHPAHGLLSSTDFLNYQLAKHVNVQVTLGYRRTERYRYTGDPYHDYVFRRDDDGRKISLNPFAFEWIDDRVGPEAIQWSQVPLYITALPDTCRTLRQRIKLAVSGFGGIAGLRRPITELTVNLCDGSDSDKGFFPYKSPVILEFRRRLTIENATDRIREGERTIEKHMSVGPFMTD